jgi:hypothetical protein
MESMRGTLIGVYKTESGFAGELSYFFKRLIGAKGCTLRDLSRSLFRKKPSFQALQEFLLAEHGVSVRMIHPNQRNDRELKASAGREPCVLLEYPDQSISMFLDSTDLKALSGNVGSLKKLIVSRLDLYL